MRGEEEYSEPRKHNSDLAGASLRLHEEEGECALKQRKGKREPSSREEKTRQERERPRQPVYSADAADAARACCTDAAARASATVTP